MRTSGWLVSWYRWRGGDRGRRVVCAGRLEQEVGESFTIKAYLGKVKRKENGIPTQKRRSSAAPTGGSAKSWGKDGVNKAYGFLLSEGMDRHFGPPASAIGR